MSQPRPLRVASWIACGLFVLSAVVQLNDPDWIPWFVFYVLAAVVSLLAPRRREGVLLAAGLALGALGWAGYIASLGLEPITAVELVTDLRMKTLNVERWREIGGLVLVGGMLGGIAWGAHRVHRPSA